VDFDPHECNIQTIVSSSTKPGNFVACGRPDLRGAQQSFAIESENAALPGVFRETWVAPEGGSKKSKRLC